MTEESLRRLRTLSFGARGLLDELRRLNPAADKLDASALAELSPANGRDSVRKLLDELEGRGALWRRRVRRGSLSGGRVAGGVRIEWGLDPTFIPPDKTSQ